MASSSPGAVQIDRVGDPGLRVGEILIDAGYSRSAVFRQALTERGLIWAVDIPYRQLVQPAYSAMTV